MLSLFTTGAESQIRITSSRRLRWPANGFINRGCESSSSPAPPFGSRRRLDRPPTAVLGETFEVNPRLRGAFRAAYQLRSPERSISPRSGSHCSASNPPAPAEPSNRSSENSPLPAIHSWRRHISGVMPSCRARVRFNASTPRGPIPVSLRASARLHPYHSTMQAAARGRAGVRRDLPYSVSGQWSPGSLIARFGRSSHATPVEGTRFHGWLAWFRSGHAGFAAAIIAPVW